MQLRTVKIAENNVEVQQVMVDADTNEEIIIKEKTESYGKDRLTAEMESNTKALEKWMNIDAEEYKQAQIAKLQAERTKLEEIKALIES